MLSGTIFETSFLKSLSLGSTKQARFSSMSNNKDENGNSRAGFFSADFNLLLCNGNHRRTNIGIDGGYCLITIHHWQVANEIARKLMGGL